ncbi:hypothetical protein [Natrarchaeobius halalkaliphilus]|uniref:hypothetical protein n=1 Tax=Natrarchaeobius halalkaliphilus TaxID=1679091 RepID=UPI000F53FA11|nr:hypothetical protein [Natrarchaeobius halalkaliphilus]
MDYPGAAIAVIVGSHRQEITGTDRSLRGRVGSSDGNGHERATVAPADEETESNSDAVFRRGD